MLEQEALVDWNHSMDNEAGAYLQSVEENRFAVRHPSGASPESAKIHFIFWALGTSLPRAANVERGSFISDVLCSPYSYQLDKTDDPSPPLPCSLRVKENFHFRLVTSISRSAVNILIY
ncbi:uncharacterized protein CCOS01_04285 [Colletotrichum costaricense]|uniref:Uncharacterized protein n=1 Tax=Colletotrichum costaricense TaxID=1209916 RepID=A0AAI9Z3R0_9PEZI|nr:uncharacterized protein CCOS01_04285 [Colletotrichum costaricense]KAK1532302.1 hypothetical protein CCOS01_04285 [Colletotrichum costaricense]